MSKLDKQAGMLPVEYQYIRRRINSIIECVGSENKIEWKTPDTCCTLEKILTIEGLYISKVMQRPIRRNKCTWPGTPAKILVRIIILTEMQNKAKKNLCMTKRKMQKPHKRNSLNLGKLGFNLERQNCPKSKKSEQFQTFLY